VGQVDAVFQPGKVNDAFPRAIKCGEQQEVFLVNISAGYPYCGSYHCLKIDIRECDHVIWSCRHRPGKGGRNYSHRGQHQCQN